MAQQHSDEKPKTAPNDKARILAHDIKNSLAVIRMDAEVALMGSPSQSETREILTRIIVEVDRINELLKKN